MKNRTLNERAARKKLENIIQEIDSIKIIDGENSLFSFQNNHVSAESLVYILLRASKELGFKINDEFVNSLGEYSFNNIISSITTQHHLNGNNN